MRESNLSAPCLAERVTVVLGETSWHFQDVTVVAHRVVPAVDLWKGEEHLATAPLSATMIEWKAQPAGFRARTADLPAK